MISSCFLGKFISESEIIRFEWSCRHTRSAKRGERGGKKDFPLCLPLRSAMIQGQIKILALFLSFLFVALDSFVSLLIHWKLQTHFILLGIILASVNLRLCQNTGFSFWFSKGYRQVFNLKHILSPPVLSRALKLFVLRTCCAQEWAKLLIVLGMCVYVSAVHIQEPISDLSDATVVQQFHNEFFYIFQLHFKRKKELLYFAVSFLLPLLYFYIFSSCRNMWELGWPFLWVQISRTSCLSSLVCKPDCSFTSFPQAVIHQQSLGGHGFSSVHSPQSRAWT